MKTSLAFIFLLALACPLAVFGMAPRTRPAEVPQKSLNILIVAPGTRFLKSHLAFAKNVALTLANQRHNVHLLVIRVNKKEGIVEENGITTHYYTPQGRIENPEKESEKKFIDFLKYLKDNSGKHNSRINSLNWAVFKQIIEWRDVTGKKMSKARKLGKKLQSIKFHVAISEPILAMQSSFFLFKALGIPALVTMRNFSLRPQQYYDFPDQKEQGYWLVNKLVDRGIPDVIHTDIGHHLEENRNPEWYDSLAKKYKRDVDNVHEALKDEVDINFPGFPDWVEMYENSRFVWINSQPELEFDDTIFDGVDKVGLIGGIHMGQQSEQMGEGGLMEEIATKRKEMAKENRGKEPRLVLISFGSAVDTSKEDYFPEYAFEAIRGAIAQFAEEFPKDYLFVWKLTEGDPKIGKLQRNIKKGRLPNLFVLNWMDQAAILADEHKPVFMSHCGRNSQYEAVYNAVPVICVPNFGDQFYNAESMARRRLAIVLPFKDSKTLLPESFTEPIVVEALKEALGLSSPGRIDLDKVEEVSANMRQRLNQTSPEKVIKDHMAQIGDELVERGEYESK